MDNVKISKAIFGFFLAVSGSIYIYYNLDLNRTITLFYQTDLQFLFLGFISLSIGYCLRVFSGHSYSTQIPSTSKDQGAFRHSLFQSL